MQCLTKLHRIVMNSLMQCSKCQKKVCATKSDLIWFYFVAEFCNIFLCRLFLKLYHPLRLFSSVHQSKSFNLTVVSVSQDRQKYVNFFYRRWLHTKNFRRVQCNAHGIIAPCSPSITVEIFWNNLYLYINKCENVSSSS